MNVNPTNGTEKPATSKEIIKRLTLCNKKNIQYCIFLKINQ